MKSTLTFLTVMSLNLVNAQCPPEPSCSYAWNSSNGVNQNFNQSVCIYGKGVVSGIFSNWNYLKFEASTGNMNVTQTLNVINNVWIYSDIPHKVILQDVVLNDTIILSDASELHINNISGSSVIIKGLASVLKVNGQYFNEGDTINNNIYVIGCNNVPLENKVIDFKINQNILSWFVEDSNDIQIQYSEDSKNFRTIHFTSQNQGFFPLREAGFYRIKADSTYSIIKRYNINELRENKIYYYMGNFYKQQPKTPYYGTKSK